MSDSNNRGYFVAVATYHDQPPIETPARIWTEAKRFEGTDQIADVWAWVANKGMLPNKIEIVQDA